MFTSVLKAAILPISLLLRISGFFVYLFVTSTRYLYVLWQIALFLFHGLCSSIAAAIFQHVFHKLKQHPAPPPEQESLVFQAPYIYGNLTEEAGIRLLVLHAGREFEPIICSIIEGSLKWWWLNYEALSYAWGDPTPRNIIYVNGRTLKITDSLEAAMRHLRSPWMPRILWVDAVCINQADGQEKSAQVRQMGEIYARAVSVVVWLGEDDERYLSGKAFRSIKKIVGLFPSWYEIKKHSADPAQMQEMITRSLLKGGALDRMFGQKSLIEHDIEPVIELFNRPWFGRRWVIQEYVRSQRAIAMCGDKTVAMRQLTDLSVLFSLMGAGHMSKLFMTADGRRASQALDRVKAMYLIKSRLEGNLRTSLLNILLQTRTFLASNAVDTIFAIIGLANDVGQEDSDILPHYPLDISELSKRVIVWGVIKRGNLGFLSLCCDDPLKEPTWVPDFSKLASCYPIVGNDSRPFGAGGDSHNTRGWLSPERDVLYLNGRIVDSIQRMTDIGWDGTFVDHEYHESSFEQLRYQAAGWFRWFKQCERLAAEDTERGNLSDDRFDELWRTMMCDITESGLRVTDEYRSLFQKFMEVCSPDYDWSSVQNQEPEYAQAMLQAVSRIQGAVTNNYAKRRFCVTKKGHFGILPSTTVLGDLVCVFAGGVVPYLLRSRTSGGNLLVGDCYVHGMMDGEALQGSHHWDEIAIH